MTVVSVETRQTVVELCRAIVDPGHVAGDCAHL